MRSQRNRAREEDINYLLAERTCGCEPTRSISVGQLPRSMHPIQAGKGPDARWSSLRELHISVPCVDLMGTFTAVSYPTPGFSCISISSSLDRQLPYASEMGMSSSEAPFHRDDRALLLAQPMSGSGGPKQPIRGGKSPATVYYLPYVSRQNIPSSVMPSSGKLGFLFILENQQ